MVMGLLITGFPLVTALVSRDLLLCGYITGFEVTGFLVTRFLVTRFVSTRFIVTSSVVTGLVKGFVVTRIQ